MGDCLLREHGGQVLDASRMFGIPVADWLDLSTGIAPWVYPVPDLPAAVWQRLPEDDDGLIGAACEYYQATHLLPVPGSQAAIMALPRLFSSRRVAVLSPGYGEYPAAWQALIEQYKRLREQVASGGPCRQPGVFRACSVCRQ